MTSTPDTRYSLIAKLRDSQDVQAWNEFASIYQPLIFRVVAARGLQYADATDVTQEVLARVAKVVEQFDPAHASVTFRGWLYRIARNHCLNLLRSRANNPADAALPSVTVARNAGRYVSSSSCLLTATSALWRVDSGPLCTA